jgi:hypothetical protein
MAVISLMIHAQEDWEKISQIFERVAKAVA